jgi:hypothetical protein
MPGISAVSPPISAARLPATFGDAAHHRGCGVHVQLAAGEIVEKEQRLGALHQDVVDTHRYKIDADGVVAVHVEGELQLGADAVGTRHQHRFAIALGHLEQGTEAADARQHAVAQGGTGERLDAFDQGVAGVDVDTGVAIGESGCGAVGGHVGRGGKRKKRARDQVANAGPGF